MNLKAISPNILRSRRVQIICPTVNPVVNTHLPCYDHCPLASSRGSSLTSSPAEYALV